MKNNPFENKLPKQEIKNKKEQLKATIEIAKPEDWETVKKLRLLSITGKDAKMFGATEEGVEKEKEKNDQEWKESLVRDNEFFMLSRVGSEEVGLIRAWERKKEGVWHLGQAYIKDEFRDKGLGKELYRAPLHEVFKRGGKKITALIYANNDKSIHLAESLGFKKIPIILAGYDISLKYRALMKDFIAMELDLVSIKDKL